MRDPRSKPKLHHTRGPQYGLECCEASQAVTWIPVSVSMDTPRHVTGAAWHSKSSVQGRTRDGWHDVHFIVSIKYYAKKIQEKSESFYIFPEIPCIRSHYLDVRSFRCSDIYNIYSPPKFSRICSYNTYKQQHTSWAAIADVSFGPVVSVTRIAHCEANIIYKPNHTSQSS